MRLGLWLAVTGLVCSIFEAFPDARGYADLSIRGKHAKFEMVDRALRSRIPVTPRPVNVISNVGLLGPLDLSSTQSIERVYSNIHIHARRYDSGSNRIFEGLRSWDINGSIGMDEQSSNHLGVESGSVAKIEKNYIDLGLRRTVPLTC